MAAKESLTDKQAEGIVEALVEYNHAQGSLQPDDRKALAGLVEAPSDAEKVLTPATQIALNKFSAILDRLVTIGGKSNKKIQ